MGDCNTLAPTFGKHSVHVLNNLHFFNTCTFQASVKFKKSSQFFNIIYACSPLCRGAVLEATMCAWYVRPISSMCKCMHVTLTSHMHSSAVPDGTKLSLEPSLSFPFWGGAGKKEAGFEASTKL